MFTYNVIRIQIHPANETRYPADTKKTVFTWITFESNRAPVLLDNSTQEHHTNVHRLVPAPRHRAPFYTRHNIYQVSADSAESEVKF